MYSPSSRAADISRLLDPAYASGSSSSSSSTRTRGSVWASPAYRATLPPETKHVHAQTRAYVDHRGDLHDPDYRDFPVLPTPTRRTRSHNQRKSSGANHSSRRSRSASRPRYSPSYALTSRPEWERDWSDDSDDEDDDASDAGSQNNHPPYTGVSRASPRRAVTIHTTTQPYTSYTPYSDYYGDPQPLPFATSPTGSRESPIHESPLEDSPFEDDLAPPQETEHNTKTKRRQSGAPSSLLRKRRTTDSKEEVVTEDRAVNANAEGHAAPAAGEEEGPPHKALFTITSEHRDDVYVCRLPLSP